MNPHHHHHHHRRCRRRENVIASRKHAGRACTYHTLRAVTCREIKSARFTMNKLSPAGIHSRRNLRAAAFLAAAGKKERARAPNGHRAAQRAGSLIPKGRLRKSLRMYVCVCVRGGRRVVCAPLKFYRACTREICGPQLNISVDGRRNRRDIFLEESGRDGLCSVTA